jgi:glycosidase
MKLSTARALALYTLCGAFLLSPALVKGEAMLQYFNTDWNEIAEKMPELAEAGYTSLWLPPPTKGSGGLSVGYDLWDRFDLGSKDQRNTVRTRYGTEAELLRLVEIAHRFGIRVYFDNIMNHNAFDIPGFNADTPIDIYPGFVPEDFHLRVTEDGSFRKWDNTRNWGDAWQVQNLGLADLIDIANEPGTTNANFGTTEGSTFPKIKFVRHPNNPEYYCYKPDGTYVGFGLNNGITKEMLAQNPGFYSEYVEDMLHRSARWLMDRTKADGLRLDAVKHVRADFFGATFGGDKDSSDYGYGGQVQRQFNLSRGFSDQNHRDTLFDTERPRDDAMMFGEHLGEPPGYGPYIDAGMRLVDNPLREQFNGKLGNPSSGLNGFDQPGAGGFAPDAGVMHAQSHDSDYAARRELQHAFYFTRAGIGLLYTDGNHQAETLGESGGAFPRHANTSFLGQFGDVRIPNLLYIHNQFARGYQIGRWSDADFVAYERIDKRENPSMSDADGVTMLFMLNDNYANGQARSFATSFPATPLQGPGSDAYLYNYSSYGGGFYKYASQLNTVVVPPGGYFAFSWKNPDPSDLWNAPGAAPVTIYQGGQPVPMMTVVRKDGPDGDPAFNPSGAPDPVATDYSYSVDVPRVTSSTAMRFVVRADGSAANILMKLDGGIDLNGVNHSGGDPRDNPPALATDVFLGYEQPPTVERQFPELFAAQLVERNTTGSLGAETYTTGGVVGQGSGVRFLDGNTASFIYHDPQASVGNSGVNPPPKQYDPATRRLWAKTNSVGAGYKMFVYYTDGTTNPEGAGGEGIAQTKAVELNFRHNEGPANDDWWGSATMPADFTAASRYKIGIYKTGAPSLFPLGADEVLRKKKMMTKAVVPSFNPATITFRPHADYGATQTGLSEGFHVLRGRAFLERVGRASIYNTFTQTFYYDAQPPGGEIKFPAPNDTVGGSEYGAVVRTDPSVTEVWYNIADTDASNDDSATRTVNGNGGGFEPFTDSNQNGQRDTGEAFEDLNGNGLWDAALQTSWVRATEVTASLFITSNFQKEWRFNYVNIPNTGTAEIRVRLREASSAAYAQFSATPTPADDAAKHYVTLTRTVAVDGPDTRMFVAFPQADGEQIGADYKVKVWFSKSLADGTNTEQLINRFLIRIASSESGSPANGVVQGQSNYQINYNVTGDFHELQFPRDGVPFPNIYNGQADFLHTIDVAHDRPSGIDLSATRKIRVQPSAAGPFVHIKNPPEFNGDGQPHIIELPDVPSPTPEQRQFIIQVETDLDADNVSVAFDNGAATASLAPQSETALTGTVSVSPGSNVVSGTGTKFTEEVAPGSAIKIGTRVFTVSAVDSDTTMRLATNFSGTPATTASRVDVNPMTNGNRKVWSFLWQNIAEGHYTFTANVDTDGNAATIEASASRNARVVFRQSVESTNPDDTDTDDDGLLNIDESTAEPLPNQRVLSPKMNPETWSNGDIHIHNAFGQSDPLSPDTDADGLPDGLEVGWRAATTPDTDLAADTNGDGVKNFRGDLDPPFYNTLDNHGRVPGVNSQSEGGDRALRKGGTMTDPNNPDSDGDGIEDGVEDANKNGWVDGDGEGLPATFEPWLGRKWPNGKIDPGETWLETAPSVVDSDTDALSDGHGEDKNFNGVIDGDNGNRTYEAGEAWTETNPLGRDTDGDGLADGWEVANGLDPLDNGTDKFSTAASNDGEISNGADGDIDGDGFTNLTEQTNGTNPRQADTGTPPPAGAITIGPVPESQKVTVGGVTHYKEFTDWVADDLIVLDEYEGGGTNNQGGDIYPGWDGFDSSRDLVAFYARDGVADGNYYFRVDLQDLRPFAEEGNLDIYVVIDTNSPGVGERKLPDDVDELTDMRWEAVVACYSSNNGRVYVDTNRAVDRNTTSLANDLNNFTAFGVEARSQTSANGFKRAYFDSALDAVEFSISRQALLDAGWNGITPLNFQVFTTRDGTGNSPVGAGDIGGRNDIRDTIYDDFQAEDYFRDQGFIAQEQNAVLRGYFGISGSNDRGRRAKVMSVIHGNQAVQPGNVTQNLINNGAGAGYYRPLDIHEAFGAPFAMHITPTLASSIEWAKSASNGFRDGPGLNARIATLASGNAQIIDLLGSTFADHIPAYFNAEMNASNVALASTFLSNIYGRVPSTDVFWSPERVLDSGTFAKIRGLGFDYTFVDQMRHVFKWFGRSSALGDDGYRINQIEGVKTFVVNDQASTYRFQTADNGLPYPLRELFNRKARSGAQHQVVTLYSAWEDFTTKAQADAYDRNVRWMASRPWIQLVTPDQIANAQIDISVPPDGVGDVWPVKNRAGDPGAANVMKKVAPDYIDHATEENYDHWYFGLANREEGLSGKVFSIRIGVNVPKPFGILDAAEPSGLIADTWARVASINRFATSVAGLNKLAHATLGASLFVTAFHEQTNNNLSKFSTGAYISPDTDYKGLAGFSVISQAQTRNASVYKRVHDWAQVANTNNGYLSQSLVEQIDVDLDGENEYLLFNDRFFAVFERLGGRMTASWLRDVDTGYVTQVSGNFASYANSLTEDEGVSNGDAHRTSGFKDWFAKVDNTSAAGSSYTNNFYTVAAATDGVGWKFTSADGKIVKNITLPPGKAQLTANYAVSGYVKLFVRFGLSPDLLDLMQNGQSNLSPVLASSAEVNVLNQNATGTVRSYVRLAGAGLSGATFNPAAADRDAGVTLDTVQMRNQAQTQQIELEGGSSMTFALGFETGKALTYDSDGDGLPDWWEAQFGLNPNDPDGVNGAKADADGDGRTSIEEYILGLDPTRADSASIGLTILRTSPSTVKLQFGTIRDRVYRIYYRDNLQSGLWTQAGGDIPGTGSIVEYTDNGSGTGSAPTAAQPRFYKLDVSLP